MKLDENVKQKQDGIARRRKNENVKQRIIINGSARRKSMQGYNETKNETHENAKRKRSAKPLQHKRSGGYSSQGIETPP